jgi:catechol 2,3-dioxygenase-like lactoylglutathione lyase family enzyme
MKYAPTGLLPARARMFSYVCLGSNDLWRAALFYDAVLEPLGLRRCDTSGESNGEGWVGWGRYEHGGAQELALWVCTPFDGEGATPGNGTMVALSASSWDAVQRFHAAALACGGRSEGAPALRPQYNADFYAAYVRDPDGNKLAAVCRGFRAPPSGG